MTRLLARDGDIALDYALQFEEALTLRRHWSQAGDGMVLLVPSVTRLLGAQLRPAYANPRAVLDLRVRKASIHVIDRKALADALLESEGMAAETAALPGEGYYDDLLRVTTRYPYDLRRAHELMLEAGFTKGPDGVYTSPDAGRFAPEVMGIADGQEAKETTAVADYFRRAGIDAQLRLVPAFQMNSDNELRRGGRHTSCITSSRPPPTSWRAGAPRHSGTPIAEGRPSNGSAGASFHRHSAAITSTSTSTGARRLASSA